MASLGILTAGIAHEINNPINFIYSSFHGIQSIIKDYKEIISKYKELDKSNYLEKFHEIEELEKEFNLLELEKDSSTLMINISTGIQRVSEIIKGLKNFSHPNNEKFHFSNVNELIENALVLLKNEIKYKVNLIKNFQDNIRINCILGK
ncbi:MAG: hypothetical protein KDK36_20130, partial [Leptospiraceae bacterium]|nr:hypothetical protein [Leptospiraceae bacterium]